MLIFHIVVKLHALSVTEMSLSMGRYILKLFMELQVYQKMRQMVIVYLNLPAVTGALKIKAIMSEMLLLMRIGQKSG